MKETHYKLKHRVTALFAAAVMLCSMLPGAAFAEETEPQPTEETVQMEQQTEPSETDNGQTDESSPDPGERVDNTETEPVQDEEMDESEVPTADEPEQPIIEEAPAEEITASVIGAELYTDLPDAPIGSYIGSEGLPVATGNTKIGISEWPESQLEESSGSYLTADVLDNDNLTMTAPLLDGADYAVVPIMAQVEYPADGSSTDIILPDGVTVLDFYDEPAADTAALLHNSYHETSAAVMGVYVQAAADFAAQLVYTDPNGKTQTKTLNVTIDRDNTVASPFVDTSIATYAERPIPSVTSGKITKVEKVNGTWLIWFNNEPSYCCTPGADGQPKNCPLYTYENTSMVGADQYIPGDHYGNQYRIWGGLTQLSLGMLADTPAVFSAETPNLLDFCRTIYADAQTNIIENYPDSTAAAILMESAQALLNGVDTYASARGYYTYIYQPGRAGWQTVAVIGPEIGDDEPNPEPVVQEIYANWEAPAQTDSGSFDFDYGITTDKIQLKTLEKVDGSTIEIEPIIKSGTIDGGTWAISPADKQTVTTSGHTSDDNYQNNGGKASASWSLHYLTTKNILFWKWEDWKLLDDATVIMRDDIIKVQISKKDLTTKEELPGAELTLTDEKGNEINRWISTDTPHYMEKLPAGKYTLTEVTTPDGYAVAERVEFEVLPIGKVQTFEMFDDITKLQISKVDITTNEELSGAELVIRDKDGNEIDRWISTTEPHHVEKIPAGEYTLTGITAPNGYKIAESITFTVLPTGEIQTVVMKDAREDTPTPAPNHTPTPEHTPQPTPSATPAPAAPTATPASVVPTTIPKTSDNSPLGLLLAIAGISLAGLAILIYRSARRKDIASLDDEDENGED